MAACIVRMKGWLWSGCWLVIGCLLGGTVARGQEADAGQPIPPNRFYLPGEYDAHSQNFAFCQDRRGVLYVGNFAGVLEYDGLSWRTIPTRNVTKVSALLTADDGTVYVGANGEFGYLRADSTGSPKFISLSQNVRFRFEDILAVLQGPDGVYFVARSGLFRWNGRALTEWQVDTDIRAAFAVNRTIYVAQLSYGLRSFSRGVFTPVMQSAAVPGRLVNIVAMLPATGGNVLIVTRNSGLFQLSNNVIRPLSAPGNAYLMANLATGGSVLTDQTIAVGTVHGGVIRIFPDGGVKQIVRSIGGLTDQPINALFSDREGNLWLALNNGISQLEMPSPVTLFTESARQLGEVMAIRRVRNRLYVATINGLFAVDRGAVRPVAGMTASCFGLAESGGSLFVATSHGVYELSDGRLQRLTDEYALCLTALRMQPGRLYVGTENGLVLLSRSAGGRLVSQPVPGITEQVSGLADDGRGNLWVETLTRGLYRLSLATNQLTHYEGRRGLPTLLYDRVAVTSQGLLVYNGKGIYRYEPDQDRFRPYNPFGTRQAATAYWKNTLVEDQQQNIWTIEGSKKGITWYRRQATGFSVVDVPFRSLSALPINVIYPDSQGTVWFGGRDGIVQYETTGRNAHAQPYQTLIRRVETTGDRVLFDGYGPVNRLGDVVLPRAVNDISFAFSATSFPVGNDLTFSYKLENYDTNWSDSTSTKNKKEYTNLPPGDYQFRVQARNVYGLPGREATFSFQVLAPWYKRWWAIGLLLALAGLVIYWAVRWRLNRLVSEKQTLESMIRERTEEVVFQKEELEKQSDELAVKNDQLEKIDLIVQSINAEVDLANLFQVILAKFSVIRNMDNASFLVYDKPTNTFRIRALRNSRDLSHVESVSFTQEQVESRLLAQAVEVYEDIYRKDDVHFERLDNPIDELTPPRSLITIVIKNGERIEGFITLENSIRPNAFDARDLHMIRNLKEHLIAAFIKTRLLEDLEQTLSDLKNTQQELIRQEKLASVGQLTKGIVDRILNPLNYVNNFSQLSNDLVDDQITALEKHRALLPTDELEDVLSDATVLKNNLLKILDHSNSTTRILKDMQKLLREKSRSFLETDLNTFVESKARTVFQEVQADYKEFVISLVLMLEPRPIRVRLLPSEFGQVVQNIISNACYALFEKGRQRSGFVPEIRITTEMGDEGFVQLRFRDNGKGIPPRELEKLFNPFFTTKPTSAGTGLGLFMVKDIIETHRGTVAMVSGEGEFTEIRITLPILPI